MLAAICLLYFGVTGIDSIEITVAAGIAHGALLAIGMLPLRQSLYWQVPVLAIAGGLCFVFPWVQIIWLCLLTGLALGMSIGSPSRRLLFALVLQQVLILALLFFFTLPQLIGVSELLPQSSILIAVRIILICWIAAYVLAALSFSEARPEPAVTFLTTMLCLMMVLLTGLLTTRELGDGYLLIMLAVLVGGLVLAGLAWLVWNPIMGEGIANLFFRHIMALSIPFDEWQENLSQLAGNSLDASDFWQQAMQHLVDGTAIDGVQWEEDGKECRIGNESKILSQISLANMNLAISSQSRLLPTARLNLWLLARMALEYRQAKEREAQMAAEARMRTIHELGARTTHDLKNLLQALTLLCAPGKDAGGTDTSREQLLLLASRLETTLARLKGDHPNSAGGMLSAQVWWDNVRKLNDHNQVTFVETNGQFDFTVPAELFDRTLENLLHNALRKQGKEGPLDIEVAIEDGPKLTVRDNGHAVPNEIATRLFHAPLPSSEGMGIGLYQLALSAGRQGYELYLSANSLGDVAITIENKS